jgi:hypothetical protein
MAQSVTAAWDALLAACGTLYTAQGTLVSAGDPGNYSPDLIVAVMGVTAPVTRPTMGTGRSRDERVTIQVLFSAYVHGGIEAQQPANQAAWAASDQLITYLRTSPNEKLGGTCYDSHVSRRVMTPEIAWESIDGLPAPVASGRVATVDASVEVWIRT